MKDNEISLDTISADGVRRELLKNWWVIICFAVAVFFGATGLGMLTYKPVYTANATLVVRVQGDDAYSSLTQTTQMAAVYSEVFQSNALRNVISESIGEDVQGSIACSQIESTNLVSLSATSPTPRQAYLFIHAALENYENIAGYVFTDASLELVQEPDVPETPSNSSILLDNRLLLTVLAGAGMAALIVVLYVMRQTVKVSSHADSLLDGNIIGTIPHERKLHRKRRKKKVVIPLVITSPLISMAYAESVRRCASWLDNRMEAKEQQVLLFLSVLENEGKSSVLVNTAIALSELGKKVLVIDGDLRKPALYKILGRKDTKDGLSSVLDKKQDVKEAVQYVKNGDIYACLQFVSMKDPGRVLNSKELRSFLSEVREEYDYILVDCCPVAVSADAEVWMRLVDSVVLVVREDAADIRAINDTVDMIDKGTGDFSGFVLNNFYDKGQSVTRSGYYYNAY